ncbi:MAG: GTP cyclohydrolase II [Campylobacter sp.]|nr:GTP cyclohydrolase II [Campylobacter sp.]
MNVKISDIANLPTSFGMFKVQVFEEEYKDHFVLFNEPLGEVVNVRIHSECITGDTMGSLKCDCGQQLHMSLKYIAKHGGMVLYLRQEGRNIGLLNKINAYALQDKGLNTIEANNQLGFKADERTYEIVDLILKHFNIDKINLLTNNPDKLKGLKRVKIKDRIPIEITPNEFNKEYLRVKKEQMGHMLNEV